MRGKSSRRTANFRMRGFPHNTDSYGNKTFEQFIKEEPAGQTEKIEFLEKEIERLMKENISLMERNSFDGGFDMA